MNKIYVIPVNPEFQLRKMKRPYPPHNNYYNIEEDFLVYLNKHPELLTNNPNEARWHYLPIFWTYWLVIHKHGKRNLQELQNEVDRCMNNDDKTFTICRMASGPMVRTGRMIQFLGSRRTQEGYDVPNLCLPHEVTRLLPKKKYLACFVGTLKTSKIRMRMAEDFKNSGDILVANRGKGEDYFVRTMLESYVALSPRGYGGGSFRFYEAMQLGVVPFLISDIDHRPFKEFIDWSKISFYACNEVGLEGRLRKIDKQQALEMGILAAKVWSEELDYQKWCKYVLMQLETI